MGVASLRRRQAQHARSHDLQPWLSVAVSGHEVMGTATQTENEIASEIFWSNESLFYVLDG
jgi:hypothetical protein